MTNFKAIFGSFVKDAYDILINESTAEIVVISKNSKAVEKVRTVASENDNRWKVSHVPADKVFRHDFWSKYLDFFSLAQNRKILESMGLREMCLLSYDLGSLDHVKKTMFGYALMGRKKGEGLLSKSGGQMAGRNCLLVPASKLDKIIEFLDYWKAGYSLQSLFAKSEDNNVARKKAGDKIYNDKTQNDKHKT